LVARGQLAEVRSRIEQMRASPDPSIRNGLVAVIRELMIHGYAAEAEQCFAKVAELFRSNAHSNPYDGQTYLAALVATNRWAEVLALSESLSAFEIRGVASAELGDIKTARIV